MKAKDISGRRFGMLTVIERAGRSANGSALWRCVCDCGNEKFATSAHLTGGFIQSCGCLHKKIASENCFKHTEHGDSKHGKYKRLYRVWVNMRVRCNNPKAKPYPNYGGRGIKVCPEWETSFIAFKKWAIKAGYDPEAPYGQCTIDRIDCNKGYSPDNCRWVDMKAQTENRRSGRGENGQYTTAQKLYRAYILDVPEQEGCETDGSN